MLNFRCVSYLAYRGDPVCYLHWGRKLWSYVDFVDIVSVGMSVYSMIIAWHDSYSLEDGNRCSCTVLKEFVMDVNILCDA